MQTTGWINRPFACHRHTDMGRLSLYGLWGGRVQLLELVKRTMRSGCLVLRLLLLVVVLAPPSPTTLANADSRQQMLLLVNLKEPPDDKVICGQLNNKLFDIILIASSKYTILRHRSMHLGTAFSQ